MFGFGKNQQPQQGGYLGSPGFGTDLRSMAVGLLSGDDWSSGLARGFAGINERMNKPGAKRKVIKGADGFNYYQDSGERVLPNVQESAPKTPWWITNSGSVDPRYLQAKKQIAAAGKTSIVNNVPTATQPIPGYNKLPAGFVYKRQPDGQVYLDETGTPSAVAIPGTPASIKANDAAKAKKNSAANIVTTGNVVRQDIKRINWLAKNSKGATSGFWGKVLSVIPATGAYDTNALIGTITANIGFDRLQQMREASKTGGALGNVSEKEIAALQAVLGNLDQAQSQEQFLRNINRLDAIYSKILKKASAYPNAAEFGFGSQKPPKPGRILNGYRFKGGDPSEKSNWEMPQ